MSKDVLQQIMRDIRALEDRVAALEKQLLEGE